MFKSAGRIVSSRSCKFTGERIWMEKCILTGNSFGGENIITHPDDGCGVAADLINGLFEITPPHPGLMIFVVTKLG